MATPLLLPALPTELSLCWFVFHKSNADILLSANCRLIHGWRCTETQEDFNDFNDVFWLSQLRCRGGKKPPKEPQTEKPPLCLSGHGESRSLSRQTPSTGNAAVYGTEWFEAHRRLVREGWKTERCQTTNPEINSSLCEFTIWIWILHRDNTALASGASVFVVKQTARPTLEKMSKYERRKRFLDPDQQTNHFLLGKLSFQPD